MPINKIMRRSLAAGDIFDNSVDFCAVLSDELALGETGAFPPIIETFVVVNPLISVAVIHGVFLSTCKTNGQLKQVGKTGRVAVQLSD